MADILVAALVDFESAPGSIVKAGQVVTVPQLVADSWVSCGRACYYSEFSEDMIKRDEPQTRVAEAPSKAVSKRSKAEKEE